MRKVFLDDLPRYEFGRYKGKINWNESVGYNVNFIYENIKDKVGILDYQKETNKVLIEYKENKLYIATNHFIKCKLGRVIGKRDNNFKIEIGESLKDKKRDIIISDKEYRKDKNGQNKKWYKYKCNTCGWEEGWIEEGNLKQGKGCACCSNKVPILGINTIWDTDRWMVDLGISEEDAKRHLSQSNKEIEVNCRDCKNNKKIKISYIYNNKSIGCCCGDGFSYPEKFMYNLLMQLEIKFSTQYSPKYLCNKFSDFYLPSFKLVIETDGRLGHKGGMVYGKSNKTLDELIKIDEWKDEQHLKNGIKTVRIDCFKSDIDYIKNSILNSELVNIFDLSKIDWVECEKFALKNIVKEVCNYWNNKTDCETVSSLSDIFSIHRKTIRGYLKKGHDCGFCEYYPKEEVRKNAIQCNMSKSKSVEVLKDNTSLGVFQSAVLLSKNSEDIFGVKFNQRGITKACRSGVKYKGFIMKYLS